MIVIRHLYAYDQFLGFSGSSGPSHWHVTNSLVSSCDTSCATDSAASLVDLSLVAIEEHSDMQQYRSVSDSLCKGPNQPEEMGLYVDTVRGDFITGM